MFSTTGPGAPAANPLDPLWERLYGPRYVPPSEFGVIVDKGDASHGIGPTYRKPSHVNRFEVTYSDKVRTIWDAFELSVALYPEKPFHGRRVINANNVAGEFVFESYTQIYLKVQQFASGLVKLNLMELDVEKRFPLLGLMGKNSPMWSLAELACFRQGGTTVPLYDSLSRETLAHILTLNGCATIVCDVESCRKLIKAKPDIATLKCLIVYDVPPTQPVDFGYLPDGLQVLYAEAIIAAGEANIVPASPPSATSIYSFIFTSGSTGSFPKGVLITQAAALANAAAILKEFNSSKGIEIRNGVEVVLSYLPQAHAMERTMQVLMLCSGSAIGFSQGIRERVMDDLAKLRPTMFASVPRILNRIHDKIMSGAREAGGVKWMLFQTALEAKISNLRAGYLKHPVYDGLVFDPIKQRIGLDRCRTIITGSAPIAGNVLDFLRAAFSIFVMEGYGASELTCIASGTHAHFFSNEHVGGPSSIAEIRLIDVPQLNYLTTDTKHGDITVLGRGEICVRGACVMESYYKEPDKTAQVLDKDGFYHTGDVGVWLPNGTLKIVDRVGSILKLSNGEYVAPESVENCLIRSQYISQAFVHGDALFPFLVAVIVPDPDVCIPWAKSRGLTVDMESLCKLELFKQLVMSDIDKICRENGLRSYEVPKAIHLESAPFTPDNILTVTQKMQRKTAAVYYKDVLTNLLKSV